MIETTILISVLLDLSKSWREMDKMPGNPHILYRLIHSELSKGVSSIKCTQFIYCLRLKKKKLRSTSNDLNALYHT